MSFIRLICKASRISKAKNHLKQEKEIAVKISRKEDVKLSLKYRYRHFWINIRVGISKFFRKCLTCSYGKKRCHKTCYKLRHDGSFENYLLKSVLGFLGGILLAYLLFFICVIQLSFSFLIASTLCSILGIILTIGLAFSLKVRCVVLLTLPQFFSKRGREALLAYAFMLAIAGPAKNTLNNLGILSDSLACGQEQLRQAVRQIVDAVKKPFLAIRDAIKAVVKTVKEIIKKIKEILLKIKRIIMAIVKVIKSAFQFLGKIFNICNKQLGTPFDRCTRLFESAIDDCQAKLGPMFSWLCSITYLVQGVCYIVKPFDIICMVVDFIGGSVIGTVIRKVKQFVRHVKTMFYVRIKFNHHFEFHTNSSKTLKEVAEGMVAEIHERTRLVVAVFNFFTCAASLFFLFLVFQVIYYRFRFLTSERYDNLYINKHFRLLDLKRAGIGRETVLPLNNRENITYITVGSTKLAASEKLKLRKSMSKLASATLKLCIHMAADYSLFWLLNVISYYGRFQSKVQAPNIPMLKIEGKGFLADLLRGIVKAFQPLGIQLEIDTVPCLPIPIPPNYDIYIQIAMLLFICWILTFFEPYGLRFRHHIMCYYHPLRATQRTIWLYNHILRSRTSFLKFARRQLRRKVMGTKGIEKITFKEWLRANLRCKIILYFLGPDKQQACLLCGRVFRESDDVKPITCKTPGCLGTYCEDCYADLQNMCTVCLSPIDYGDVSDMSEEKDSSGDYISDANLKTRKKICPFKRRRKQTKRQSSLIEHYLQNQESDESVTEMIPGSSSRNIPTKNNFVENPTDSDYDSAPGTATDVSTDYSHSYQFDEKVTSDPITSMRGFRDVEKQRIPDYASLENYRQADELNKSQKEELGELSEVSEDEVEDDKHKIDKQTSRSAKKSFTLIGKKIPFVSKKKKSNIEDVHLLSQDSEEELNDKIQTVTSDHIEMDTFEPQLPRKIQPFNIPNEESGISKKSFFGKSQYPTERSSSFIESQRSTSQEIQKKSSISDEETVHSYCKCSRSTSFMNSGTDSSESRCKCDHSPKEKQHYSNNKSAFYETSDRYYSKVPFDLEISSSSSTSLERHSSRSFRSGSYCQCSAKMTCKHDRFKYMKYEEVTETSSSPRTDSTTSSLSCYSQSIISPSCDSSQEMRNDNCDISIAKQPHIHKKQRRESTKKRLGNYYKKISGKQFPKLFTSNNQGSSILRTMKKIVKSKPKPIEEESVELLSFNYTQDHWEKICHRPSSPSSDSCEDDQQNQERIRGGGLSSRVQLLTSDDTLCRSEREQEQISSSTAKKSITKYPGNRSNLRLSADLQSNILYLQQGSSSFTIEDLRPTKDLFASMTTTGDVSVIPSAAYSREPPEKDDVPDGNRGSIPYASGDFVTAKNIEEQLDEDGDLPDSDISDEECANILGSPYELKRKCAFLKCLGNESKNAEKQERKLNEEQYNKSNRTWGQKTQWKTALGPEDQSTKSDHKKGDSYENFKPMAQSSATDTKQQRQMEYSEFYTGTDAGTESSSRNYRTALEDTTAYQTAPLGNNTKTNYETANFETSSRTYQTALGDASKSAYKTALGDGSRNGNVTAMENSRSGYATALDTTNRKGNITGMENSRSGYATALEASNRNGNNTAMENSRSGYETALDDTNRSKSGYHTALGESNTSKSGYQTAMNISNKNKSNYRTAMNDTSIGKSGYRTAAADSTRAEYQTALGDTTRDHQRGIKDITQQSYKSARDNTMESFRTPLAESTRMDSRSGKNGNHTRDRYHTAVSENSRNYKTAIGDSTRSNYQTAMGESNRSKSDYRTALGERNKSKTAYNTAIEGSNRNRSGCQTGHYDSTREAYQTAMGDSRDGYKTAIAETTRRGYHTDLRDSTRGKYQTALGESTRGDYRTAQEEYTKGYQTAMGESTRGDYRTAMGESTRGPYHTAQEDSTKEYRTALEQSSKGGYHTAQGESTFAAYQTPLAESTRINYNPAHGDSTKGGYQTAMGETTRGDYRTAMGESTRGAYQRAMGDDTREDYHTAMGMTCGGQCGQCGNPENMEPVTCGCPDSSNMNPEVNRMRQDRFRSFNGPHKSNGKDGNGRMKSFDYSNTSRNPHKSNGKDGNGRMKSFDYPNNSDNSEMSNSMKSKTSSDWNEYYDSGLKDGRLRKQYHGKREEIACNCDVDSTETPSDSTPEHCTSCPCRSQPPLPPPMHNCHCHEHDSDGEVEGVSSETSILELTYQNNDEYMDLVQELEDTLHTRNKHRVQRTMQEFEKRSRQNRNLERPVFDDSEEVSAEDAPILEKLTKITKASKHHGGEADGCSKNCPYCGKRKQQKSIGNREKYKSDQTQLVGDYPSDDYQPERGYVENVIKYMDPTNKHQQSVKYPKFKKNINKSHWEFDSRSGEWVKLSLADEIIGRRPASRKGWRQCNCQNCQYNNQQNCLYQQQQRQPGPEYHSQKCRCYQCKM